MENPASLRDAIEVIRSAVAMGAMRGTVSEAEGNDRALDPRALARSSREVQALALQHVRSVGLGL